MRYTQLNVVDIGRGSHIGCGWICFYSQALRAWGHHSTAHKFLDEEKWKHAGLAQRKSYWPSIFAQDAMLAKGIQSLRPAVDWFDSFTGLGWLLVASNSVPPLAVPISILWVRLGKSKWVVLDVRHPPTTSREHPKQQIENPLKEIPVIAKGGPIVRKENFVPSLAFISFISPSARVCTWRSPECFLHGK